MLTKKHPCWAYEGESRIVAISRPTVLAVSPHGASEHHLWLRVG